MYIARVTVLRSYDAVVAPGDLNGLTFLLPPRVQELDLEIVNDLVVESEVWRRLPRWKKWSPRFRLLHYGRRAKSPKRVKFKPRYWEQVVQRGRLSKEKILVEEV